ncbi:MAG: hypothetical protein JWN60_2439 [Acidobacteria bacterium]|jgi:hypothetical protein|nr:hypothetical protein [Acidobacteriota bacterium]
MADHLNTESERTATPDESAYNQAPGNFSKATLAVIGVAILFIIIATVMFSGFLNDSTGEAGTRNENSASRANP